MSKNAQKNGSKKENVESEEKHCICESRDYTILMICCDYCSIWYHAKCMGITKGEAGRIDKYACKPCQAKDPKNTIIYKENAREKTNGSIKRRHHISVKSTSKKNAKEHTVENDVKKDQEKTSSKKRKKSASYLPHEEIQKQVEPASNETSALQSIPIKNEPNSPGPSQIDAAALPISLFPVTKQQKLQEEHPDLRCGNCIGCFRDKDCGKCVICAEGTGSCCIQRVCVQVEELLKQNEMSSKILKTELTEVVDCGGTPESNSQIGKSRKGRKPKSLAVTIKQECERESSYRCKKRRSYFQQLPQSDKDCKDIPVAAQLNKYYHNWMRSKQKKNNQQLPKSEDEEKQCYGTGCTNSVRPGSKYCSEKCGLELAKLRLKTILPQRFNEFFYEQPVNHKIDSENMENLGRQIEQMKQQLSKLEEWKENVHTFIVALKNAHPSSEIQRNEDESLVFGCPVCAGEFPMREIAKHMQSCYVRSERQTTYGTDYKIPNNQYNLYCEEYNKINNTYCKRLRYACAEHYKDEYDLKICGYPLNWQKKEMGFISFHELFHSSDAMMANYCQKKGKSCRDHHNWIQTVFSMIDNERMNLLNRIEEIEEQRLIILKMLFERGDVLSLLCNRTIRTAAKGHATNPVNPNSNRFEKQPQKGDVPESDVLPEIQRSSTQSEEGTTNLTEP